MDAHIGKYDPELSATFFNPVERIIGTIIFLQHFLQSQAECPEQIEQKGREPSCSPEDYPCCSPSEQPTVNPAVINMSLPSYSLILLNSELQSYNQPFIFNIRTAIHSIPADQSQLTMIPVASSPTVCFSALRLLFDQTGIIELLDSINVG
ncbi:hypothetical protein NQZ68_027192 [Dissostichus eleginoides]|nr:hypothetical protein NQZ68_027192 [Dissostichus eleginoides]